MMKKLALGLAASLTLATSVAFAAPPSFVHPPVQDHARVPELSASGTGGALVFVVGGVLVLAGRRRRSGTR
jgi:hypothetical protein